MGITIKVNTKDFDGPGFSDWMVVCYKIRNPDGFHRYDRLAVDVPGDSQVMSPEESGQVDGAPKYDLDGKGTGPGGRVDTEGQQEVEICFVTKKGQLRRGDLSLEIKRAERSGTQIVYGDWERLPYDGAPEGMGKHWVPIAMSLSPRHGHDEAVLAALASQRRLITMSHGPDDGGTAASSGGQQRPAGRRRAGQNS